MFKLFNLLKLCFKDLFSNRPMTETDMKSALAMCGIRFYSCPYCGKELTEYELKHGLREDQDDTGPM